MICRGMCFSVKITQNHHQLKGIHIGKISVLIQLIYPLIHPLFRRPPSDGGLKFVASRNSAITESAFLLVVFAMFCFHFSRTLQSQFKPFPCWSPRYNQCLLIQLQALFISVQASKRLFCENPGSTKKRPKSNIKIRLGLVFIFRI